MKEPVSEVYRHGEGRDADCLVAALAEGISGNSRLVATYEATCSAQFGAPHAIAVSSGSAAVMAALAGLGLPRGGSVIVSPLAPLCTVYPIMALGLEPVFCDTNAADFGLCLADFARVLSAKTVAVLDVPMWGYPIPSDRVRETCDRHGLPLVLDLAHGHNILLHGRDLSSYGRIATFSTHEGKILSTGEGGLVLTEDAALARAVRDYTRFGNLDGRTFGINLKMSGLQAALGERRMLAFRHDLAARRRKAQLFFDRLDSPVIKPWPLCPGGEANFYAILVEVLGDSPRGVIEAMGAAGVPSDKLKYPCQTLYRFDTMKPFARLCPNAEALIERLSTVPVHPDLDDATMIAMAETINRSTAAPRRFGAPSPKRS
ncbi:MAG: DegT/DnrJ/EryC1/StrS family aminotransferase [Byssovorax sp.]